MSSELAISVRGVSKAYTIADAEQRPRTLVESLWQRARHPLRRAPKTTFWALRDLSFDVGAGEVVGVIGRNGAGKSTLLKLLSRITAPTTGEIDLYGRVGSLLEVGTGFHPELTGTENIFLNGAILGMTKAEIRRQFDAIVDFAGVAKFLATPVKRYSSGMYVRLAFAVAAHLNPEILIVDEVLAVGDAAFQQKCLGKMGEVASQGRTVLFVSHNMGAVRALCTSVIVNEEGLKVASIQSIEEGCDFWELTQVKRITCELPDLALMPGDYRLNIEVCDQHTAYLQAESAMRFSVEPRCVDGSPWAYNKTHGIYRIARGVHIA